KLEADAEALRRELGEDRWLLVFRNAGKQALKMCQSVSRSVEKLATALDRDEQHTDTAALAKKIESYEAKKNHYGTAIERVLAIIDRGVLDRLTVNGEILGLQSDMKRKWASIQAEMRELDSRLLGVNLDLRNQQLRDSELVSLVRQST
ncbi:karyogamy protein, partial [Aureobasidium melanogenum]